MRCIREFKAIRTLHPKQTELKKSQIVRMWIPAEIIDTVQSMVQVVKQKQIGNVMTT